MAQVTGDWVPTTSAIHLLPRAFQHDHVIADADSLRAIDLGNGRDYPAYVLRTRRRYRKTAQEAAAQAIRTKNGVACWFWPK
jgi:hypothetical protein